MLEAYPSAKALMKYRSSSLLYILGEKGSKRTALSAGGPEGWSSEKLENERELIRLFEKATEEMAAPKLVTISLNELKVLRDHDFGSGEIYVLTSVVDNSGIREYETPLFHGISDGDFLPLGPGGMLIYFQKDPGLFLDLHGIIMESDSDVRTLGNTIEKAKIESKFDEIEKIVKVLTSFDPSKLTEVFKGVSLFLNVLVELLKANGDDHVGTFHDFYLRQQALGVGRHPQTGRYQYNDIEIAYKISMIDAKT